MGSDNNYFVYGMAMFLTIISVFTVTGTLMLLAKEPEVTCDGCTEEYGCEVIVDKEDYKLLICEK